MSYRDEPDIGPSEEELIAAKGPFGFAVIAIVIAFFGCVGAVVWLLSFVS
jgi:hypothetical protein